MNHNKLDKLLASMLTENTGIAMMDSGGENGRAWQRNAGKTVYTFKAEPEVSFEIEADKYGIWNAVKQSRDLLPESEWTYHLDFSVSTFHYLASILELDDLCDSFNAKPVKDWGGELFGTSETGDKWIKKHFTVGDIWNTYNGENTLDRILQGTNLRHVETDDKYILLQIHGGADVRGGYTDAKLFKLSGAFQESYLNSCPNVFGEIDGKSISTLCHGYKLSLENDDGSLPDEPTITKDSKIILSLNP